MTNWITATGFALIVGGIATLICFRRMLWSGQLKRRDATARRTARIRAAGTAPRPLLPAQGSAPEISGAHLMSGAVPDGAYGDHDWIGEFDPSAVVPTWPPARPADRVELARTSSEEPAGRHQAGEVAGRHWEQLDRDGRDGWRRGHGSGEGEDLTLRRPQSRPNPAGYVSRHAAEEQR